MINHPLSVFDAASSTAIRVLSHPVLWGSGKNLKRLSSARSKLAALLAMAWVSANAAETERLFLSGHDRDDAVPWEFRCSPGAQAGEWSTIPVPSNWELQGFGTFSYGQATPADVGEYRHTFTAPSTWSGKRVFLVFDGVSTDTTARLNGQPVGPTHRGGFYRFKYEVTTLLRPGAPNVLEVRVEETSSDESVNRAERTGDYWNFGGIYRPVSLEAVPATFIERVAIDARANGDFAVDVIVNGPASTGEVTGQIVSLDGTAVGKPFSAQLSSAQAGAADSADVKSVRLTTRIENPARWTAETPKLYRVELALRDGGRVQHQMTERFGFRTFEVRHGDGFYLNGQRVVLQGANRHSFHPDSGRCLSERDHRADIELMRAMNMNAVRMSHYPPDKRFLELCDELGLYVLDELAGWQKSYSEAAGRPLVAEMVQRDVNHPSVLIWDNGNEGGWETALDADFARWDPQGRPVLHPWDLLNGVNASHYRTYDQTVPMAAGEFPGLRRHNLPVTEKGPFIFVPTEFLHALFDGGAGAGLEDYWNVMRNAPYPGGGFIWALVDEGVKRPDTGKMDVRGNAAPDGIVGPYREKEASFFTIKELWSPIVVGPRTLPADFAGTIALENRYGFTDVAACRFTWQLRRLPAAGDRDFATAVLSEGVAKSPSIQPGQNGELRLALPANWRDADVLSLRVDDPDGHELWTSTWAVPGQMRLRDVPAEIGKSAGEPEVTETADRLSVVSRGLAISFDRATGALASVQRNGQTFSFGNGPRLAVGDAKLTKLSSRLDAGDVVVTADYSGAMKTVEWRVRTNGWVDCDFVYTTAQPAPLLGVCFDYPAGNVKSKRWVGAGPYRVWQNRLRGTSLGAWENAYNDTVTGWSGWVYPEFKGIFRDVQWLSLDTTEGKLTVIVRTPELYVQVLTPTQPPEELRKGTNLKLADAGLSFLHVIPAIGTKFDTPEKLGPQSQVPPVQPEYRGSVSFRFGE